MAGTPPATSRRCRGTPSARFTWPGTRCGNSRTDTHCESTITARAWRPKYGRFTRKRSLDSDRVRRSSSGITIYRRSPCCSRKPRTPVHFFKIWREPIVPALHELQRAVYRSLVAHDDDDAGVYIRADGVAAAARLSVYRNTFIGTLTNALRLSYPAVHRLVGVEFFETSARMFIEGQPPRSAYLDEYGAAFPEFLARFPAATSVPYLADVARLEWAVNRALH